jgi:hypothetical protein
MPLMSVGRGRATQRQPSTKIRAINQPAKLQGLGDLVAKIANPIAKAVGLNKSKCGCQKRQEWLNQAVPFQRQDSAK